MNHWTTPQTQTLNQTHTCLESNSHPPPSPVPQALSDSLNNAVRPDDSYFNKLVRIMCTRCMTQALYFGSGEADPADYHHYGLAAPIYTHFTSPIRRYADVVVHRLLAAAIGLDPLPDRARDRCVCVCVFVTSPTTCVPQWSELRVTHGSFGVIWCGPLYESIEVPCHVQHITINRENLRYFRVFEEHIGRFEIFGCITSIQTTAVTVVGPPKLISQASPHAGEQALKI